MKLSIPDLLCAGGTAMLAGAAAWAIHGAAALAIVGAACLLIGAYHSRSR